MPVETTDAVLTRLGLVGEAVHFLLVANAGVAGVLVLAAVPLYFVLRDVVKTVDRFGVLETDLTADPDEPYAAAAREVFAERPETAVFCYGHTHRPLLNDVEGRVLVNTGTWLKRPHRRDVVAGLLPPVFYPSNQLWAVRIAAEPDGVAVEFEAIEKDDPSTDEITRTERLLTLGRAPTSPLPDHPVVTDAGLEPPFDSDD